MPGQIQPFTLYLRLVTAAGAVALLGLALAGASDIGPLDAEFWVLAALVLVGELFPIQVHGQVGEETFSTPFAFALLLVYGVPEVVVVQVAASLVADLIRRRPIDRIVFNLAQLTLSWIAAGAVFEAMGGSGLGEAEGLMASDLPAIAVCAVVFFIANSTIVRTAEALLQQSPIGSHLLGDLLFRSWSNAILFALGLPVAVIAEEWLYLVPVLALPMAAVHRASKQASEMEHFALHDPMTTLPNRSLLLQRTDDALGYASTGEHGIALLILGLDRFKDVNDTLGRAQGDRVLVEIASRLKRSVRNTDTVARVEGDRFGVLLSSLPHGADAAAAAEKIVEEMGHQIDVASATLSVDATVGVACGPRHGNTAEQLLQRAETAMYRAKRTQSRLEFFSPELEDEAPRRLVLVTALKRAIDVRAIKLHYQPKIELARGRVVGVEALARWTDPVLGQVGPSTFVPLAERTGLAEPLTSLALQIAAADCRRWRDQGCFVPVAVNVSARMLVDPRLPELVDKQRRECDLPEDAIEIEITESTLMGDHAQAREALARLRAIGIRTSIDDFGTGYSSLSYLRELPVHALKIDRSFITDLVDEPDSEAIVRSIIELARNLGLETVAEGVEDERATQRLMGLGCDYVQGFAIARPMTADAMLRWLRAYVPST
ncbi:MAG TPA: EAL domain-containing protein [Thermoleophilaceae bacterium]